MSVAVAILAFVTLQRLGELLLSARNSARLIERGAVEVGRRHYPMIVAVHAAWLVALWALAPGRAIDWAAMIVFLALQPVRGWVIATLGPRWTTRILVLPGAPLIQSGPYRWVRHPNYLVVAAEIALLPLAFDLWLPALLFSLANAAVLAIRIRAENAALARASATR